MTRKATLFLLWNIHQKRMEHLVTTIQNLSSKGTQREREYVLKCGAAVVSQLGLVSNAFRDPIMKIFFIEVTKLMAACMEKWIYDR